jgi:hypothetical protein
MKEGLMLSVAGLEIPSKHILLRDPDPDPDPDPHLAHLFVHQQYEAHANGDFHLRTGRFTAVPYGWMTQLTSCTRNVDTSLHVSSAFRRGPCLKDFDASFADRYPRYEHEGASVTPVCPKEVDLPLSTS